MPQGERDGLESGYDLVLIDTAGRLHIDEALMLELREIKSHIKPKEVILVADAMTGQDAVNIAKNFHERLGIRWCDSDQNGWRCEGRGCPFDFAR